VIQALPERTSKSLLPITPTSHNAIDSILLASSIQYSFHVFRLKDNDFSRRKQFSSGRIGVEAARV
jgi:hypothetical protein